MNAFERALRLLDERQETRWELGLGRIRGLLHRLGDPQDAVPAIHVAGTNGKGSFCALLASVLGEAGLKPGLYTSPHLSTPTERIVLDGEAVSPEAFGELLERVRRAEEEPATYFELLTAAAFVHFQESGARAAVLETGLGGRLDATNVVARPALTVITSIGLDHVQHLGPTVADIAREKAGILKAGVPVLLGPMPAEARAVIDARARELGCPVLPDAPALEPARSLWEEGRQIAGKYEISLLGRAALANAGLVLAAVAELRRRGWTIPEEAVARGLRAARWPCRFEPVSRRGKTVILDGAHNEDAMKAFLETWKASPWSRGGTLVFGVLADKDWKTLAALAASAGAPVVCVRPDSPRALAAETLAARLLELGASARVAPSLEAALDSCPASAAVCGSFYLAGAARRALQGACA
ncbi:MAG TPA: folylpolyglutamate synthase/dihydrofolate synthase family protein [Elusimicrobiota bacterium]|nr:folylpolyglutamate synthase/dihydrofolate synthase family protein [Elusimicrobiota bacterium]